MFQFGVLIWQWRPLWSQWTGGGQEAGGLLGVGGQGQPAGPPGNTGKEPHPGRGFPGAAYVSTPSLAPCSSLLLAQGSRDSMGNRKRCCT